jgi:hypothetical protein
LEPKPRMVRVADGLSAGLDSRVEHLGNAVVPQVVAELGRLILEADAEHD